MQRFRVAASGHSVNYLPQYVADRLGFFADEGLEIDTVVPDPWDGVLTEIGQGSSHAALGGIWVPSMFWRRGRDLVAFAQLSARCPLVIVGRVLGEPTSREPFDLRQLEHHTVLVPGSNGASPGVFLNLLLAEQGVDLAEVSIVQNLSDVMLVELFSGGLGDFLLIDPISALGLVDRGVGGIVYSLAEGGGAVPWSAYYCTREALDANRETLVRFTRALDRGLDWVLRHTAAELGPMLPETFPTVAPDRLLRHVDELRAHSMWHTARVDRQPYERWQAGLERAHLVELAIPYASLVDGEIADAAGVPAAGGPASGRSGG